MPVDIAFIHPERPALVDDHGTTVTFAELLDRATRLGRAMHAAGVPSANSPPAGVAGVPPAIWTRPTSKPP